MQNRIKVTIALGLVWLAGCGQKRADDTVLGTVPGEEESLRRAFQQRVVVPKAPAKTPETLKPGEFVWRPEAAPEGPVLVVVSLPEQRAYVYRNGIAIGVSTVSTGKKGHETPTGVFTVLEMHKVHHSNKYNNAPMPNMERLTWDGVALHAGKLPGYPASHGCVRMPLEFSALLFGASHKGVTVVISGAHSDPAHLVHPGLIAPTTPDAKQEVSISELAAGRYEWSPDRAPDGPVSLLLSSADEMIYVFRGGIEIGRSRIQVVDSETPLGAAVYTVLEGSTERKSELALGRPALRWMGVSLEDKNGKASPLDVIRRLRVNPEFAELAYNTLEPGSTVMVTDASATPATRGGTGMTVMTNEGVD
jgi:hypothetical protein